ncbi:hypothetical protein NPIL_161811 [Nephila pilipes]|uniref:Uncharacterized protein n=1 Tax=Nephila pilipes TaxID=299642 RepID=A0A8X6NIL3_NEPPI|nr:hypothetical protein NPIL_161811 [Nephila pilipes]
MKLIHDCLFFSTFFIFLSLTPTWGSCPPPYSIFPCSCPGNKSIVVCKDVTNEEDLASVMKASKKQEILGVELHSVSFRYIPQSAFNGTNIKVRKEMTHMKKN